jgi:hypothetical protein
LKYHEALKSLYQTYGPLVRENLGGRVIVHVFHPEDIKTVELKFGIDLVLRKLKYLSVFQVYSHEGKYPRIPPLQETTQIYRAQKQMSLGL